MSLTDEDKAWIEKLFEEQTAWIQKRFEKVDQRFEDVDKRFENLTTFTLDMRKEITSRFDAVDQRLDFMANAMLNVQPLTKGMVDLGSLMGQLTRQQMQSTDRHFDLETRVLKLEETLSKLIRSAA
jgi:tetrahydromethanopterin S-methyltransferase subunit G